MCTPNIGNTLDTNGYGSRPDGTPKGKGYWGELKRPDGGVSTEITTGVNIDGKETNIPLLVPTLDPKEVKYLLDTDPHDKNFYKNMPPTIMDKAVKHALKRKSQGLSVYAD